MAPFTSRIVIKFIMSSLVVVGGYAAATAAELPATVPPPSDQQTLSPTEQKAALEMLQKALDTATASGKSADIDADALLAATRKKAPETEAAGSVAAGDLADVEYSASLEDGALFFTTREKVAKDPATRKISWYNDPPHFSSEAVTAGKAAFLPGIGEAVTSMRVGEKKRLVLSPEQAFGQPDPKKATKLPLSRTLPKKVSLGAEEYVKQFGGFPAVGREVPVTPYFPARVTAVGEKEVTLELLAENGKSYPEPYGTTTVTVAGDRITLALAPRIGAALPLQNGVGIITASDDSSFTVDMNNPLAGKKIVIDLELTGLTKAAALPAGDYPWQDKHDEALAQAKSAGKPAVLVLYADWCSFCKKLFGETMPDPRITSLRDRFAWVKVNSDKQAEYKQRYGQDGFPMIVLFRADGSIDRKLNGFQEPAALRAALQGVL